MRKNINVLIVIIFISNFLIFKQDSSNNQNKNNNQTEKRNLFQKIRKRKIRIFIDDTYMKSQNNGKYSFFINSLKNAANYWSKILKVERLQYKLTKPMFSDCQVNIYNSDLEENKGIEADLIIFPSFSSLEENYYAESAFCQRDSQNLRNYFVSQYYSDIYPPKDRPIAGFIKVNTNNDINK